MRSDDTIYALSTARGRAGLAVIRISGERSSRCLEALTNRSVEARRASLASFVDPENGELIDRGIALRFEGPASFTGEDVAELHVHGSTAVIARLFESLSRFPDTRLAEPGEFSRRAFRHGRLDLASVEGLADLIDAETEAQRRQAVAQAGGLLARRIESWSKRLTRALAYVEATIDFADEEIPEDLNRSEQALVDQVREEMAATLRDGRRGEIVRDGYSVALVGPPNSGKSSLLNALVGREVAITSAVAGTTRDVIEVRLDLNGVSVILADTAGLRDTLDVVEAEGVRRARDRALAADLVIMVHDSSSRGPGLPLSFDGGGAGLTVWNKTDLCPAQGDGIAVSARTGAGLNELVAELTRLASEATIGEPALVSRGRHRDAIKDAIRALEVGRGLGEVAVRAEALRSALHALGRIVGAVGIEDLLDVIFREFCIGK